MNLVEKAFALWETLTPIPASPNASIWNLVDRIIEIILMVAGALAVIYLIYSGILYITAAGNAENAKKGQQGIINAVIGVVIILLAYIILKAVARTVTDTMQ